jgi:hypothetical protein
LELFARNGLLACHFTDGSVKPLSPNNVAVRTDFYVIKDGAGARDASWEIAMSRLETTAIPVLRRIPDWPLSPQDRTTITEYLALLALRSPAFRAWHIEQSSALVHADRRAGKYSELTEEEWAYAEQYFTGQEFRTRTMARMLSRVSSILGSMHWALLRFSSPRVCISDQPLVCVPLIQPEEARKIQVLPAGGFANVMEVRAPVDPRHALLLSWHDDEDETKAITGDREMLRDLNFSIVEQAEKHWCHQPGVTPPHAARWSLPLSMRVIAGYAAPVVEGSTRRRLALQSVNEMIADGKLSSVMKIAGVRRHVT